MSERAARPAERSPGWREENKAPLQEPSGWTKTSGLLFTRWIKIHFFSVENLIFKKTLLQYQHEETVWGSENKDIFVKYNMDALAGTVITTKLYIKAQNTKTLLQQHVTELSVSINRWLVRLENILIGKKGQNTKKYSVRLN